MTNLHKHKMAARDSMLGDLISTLDRFACYLFSSINGYQLSGVSLNKHQGWDSLYFEFSRQLALYKIMSWLCFGLWIANLNVISINDNSFLSGTTTLRMSLKVQTLKLTVTLRHGHWCGTKHKLLQDIKTMTPSGSHWYKSAVHRLDS